MSHPQQPTANDAGAVVESLKPLERTLSKLQIRAVTGSAQAQSPEQREFWLGYAMALDALRTAIRSIKAETPIKAVRKPWLRTAAFMVALDLLLLAAALAGFAIYESAQGPNAADGGDHAGYSRNHGNPLALSGSPKAFLVDFVRLPSLGNGATHQLSVDGLNGARVQECDVLWNANAVQPVQQSLVAHTPDFRIRKGGGSRQGIEAFSELTRRFTDSSNSAVV